MATYVSLTGGHHNYQYTVFGKGTIVAGGGNDSLTITGKGDLTVGAGHDTLTLGNGGVISQTGAAGLDTIHLGAGKDTIYEQGHAVVYGPFGSATISGGELIVGKLGSAIDVTAVSGNVTLVGGSVPTEFIGGPGTASMTGGSSPDTFVGGTGNTTMVGGHSSNVFEFTVNEGGSHLITNFVSGQDTLYLGGDTLNSLKAAGDVVKITGGTQITIPGTGGGAATIIDLKGIKPGDLSASDVDHHKP